MSKVILADKVGNGWYVRIVDTRHLLTESDVLDLIRQEGCKVDKTTKRQDANMIIAR